MRRQSLLPALLVCALTVYQLSGGHFLAIPAAAQSGTPPGATSFKPIVTFWGRQSKIKKTKLLRIVTPEEWHAVWTEHKCGSPSAQNLDADADRLEFDFDNVMIIAVFEGEGVAATGVTAHSVVEFTDRIVVRQENHSYQTGISSRLPDPPRRQPWGMIIIPRSTKEVILEEDVRTLIADPPVWKERARFAALPEKKR